MLPNFDILTSSQFLVAWNCNLSFTAGIVPLLMTIHLIRNPYTLQWRSVILWVFIWLNCMTFVQTTQFFYYKAIMFCCHTFQSHKTVPQTYLFCNVKCKQGIFVKCFQNNQIPKGQLLEENIAETHLKFVECILNFLCWSAFLSTTL